MSAPRNTPNAPINVPSHSSSPSKSSLRRVSGGAQQRSLLPSPHFDEPVISASHDRSPEREDAIEEDSRYGAEEATQQRATPFQPFFTLIEDTSTREHFHPTVHYIFADDEADIVTEAALRSLDTNRPRDSEDSATASAASQPTAQRPAREEDEARPYFPAARSDVKEHYIVLDVQPVAQAPVSSPQLGPAEASTSASASANVSNNSSTNPLSPPPYEVANAYSTSADWQVLRSSISQAPTLGENTAAEEGLMLRIEGRGNTPTESAPGAVESIEEMIERFERGLEDVRLVLEAGSRETAVADERDS
ncbi:uncharacterized protein AB675_3543 [Cyphellophora attinorum]|uniref:Uncharacterized protein n=1 Tax=Cyphellophora attinorum TaxID=1664694 RepID=A0A0N1HAL3_9EURO|nr:uncharacterized protein AB675_3543 [Phialophora attinorum]KPI39762.1 hypothetical protein AB675_3543 [Phialophora attinorum]